MLIGILSGFIAAFLQSSTYILSKVFVLKHQKPILLTTFSSMVMGVCALFTLALIWKHVHYPWSWQFCLIL